MKDERLLHVFKMSPEDWVMAETNEQANKWYKEELGLTEEDQPLSAIVVCSGDDTYIVDPDLSKTERETFRDAIEEVLRTGKEVPFILCSTEY